MPFNEDEDEALQELCDWFDKHRHATIDGEDARSWREERFDTFVEASVTCLRCKESFAVTVTYEAVDRLKQLRASMAAQLAETIEGRGGHQTKGGD